MPKSKDTASERSRKRMAAHVPAARASKLASNPECMSFFTLPRFSLGRVQCTGNFRGNSKESKIERIKVKEDTEDKKVVCQRVRKEEKKFSSSKAAQGIRVLIAMSLAIAD